MDFSGFEHITEPVTVEKTIECYATISDQHRRIRIEAVKHQDGHYTTNSYVLSEVFIKRTYTGPETATSIWEPYDGAPWTHRNTADAALAQAVGFLLEAKAR